MGDDLRQPAADLGRPRLAAIAHRRCRCCSRASATPTTPAGRSTPASTGSSARPTAAARPTVGSPRSTACPTSSTPPATRPVVFDSGVRSGADVVKALALGARAVGDRPSLRLRPRRRRPGRHRARAAVPARRDRPHHGHRRLPDHRRPHPRRSPQRRLTTGRRSRRRGAPMLEGRPPAYRRELRISWSDGPDVLPGWVVARKSLSTATKRSGASTWGK